MAGRSSADTAGLWFVRKGMSTGWVSSACTPAGVRPDEGADLQLFTSNTRVLLVEVLGAGKKG